VQQLVERLTQFTSNPAIRKKLLFTAAIFFVYRFLAHIPLPAVDVAQLKVLFSGSQFLSLLNIFSGGTLSNFSIVAVGISPFITASIVLQLAGMVFPALKELQKDGEAGQEKITQYTRFLSVPIAVAQSMSVLALLNSQSLLTTGSVLDTIIQIVTLVTGALFLMWLGELITLYGIGNGISMLLFAGIISQFPQGIGQISAIASSDQTITLLGFGVVFLLVIGLVVFMNEAIRKVTIQYARRTRGSKVYGGELSHLPVRVNVTGVLPIIFAVSLMLVPAFVGRILVGINNAQLQQIGQSITINFQQTAPIYMASYFALVFAFTYFSALIFFKAEDISEELKKSGAFVPGIRPGKPTKEFLEFVVTRITFAGALFLGGIAILPILAQQLTGIQSLAIGGTSVLIVVSVILETLKQLDGLAIGENYDRFQ